MHSHPDDGARVFDASLTGIGLVRQTKRTHSTIWLASIVQWLVAPRSTNAAATFPNDEIPHYKASYRCPVVRGTLAISRTTGQKSTNIGVSPVYRA